jgi:uncharacterized protein YcfJ
MNLRSALFALTALSFFSCASYRPILDENQKYSAVGETKAESDIDTCMTRADAYLAKHQNERTSKAVGRGAVGGAIIGGVLGAVSGQGVKGLAGGAAMGAAGGAAGSYLGEKTKDNLSPDALKQKYVANCLERQQYQVIGWK